MPGYPARPCTRPGCRALSFDGTGRCPDHPRKAWHHEGRSANVTQQGYGWAWQQLREVILKRDGYRCQACKRAGVLSPGQEVDHIVSKANGGSDDPANLEAICTPCHRRKTATERS